MQPKIATELDQWESRGFTRWLPRLAQVLTEHTGWRAEPTRDEGENAAAPGLLITALRNPGSARYPHTLMMYATWTDEAIRRFLKAPYRHTVLFREHATGFIGLLAEGEGMDPAGGSQRSARMRFIALTTFGFEDRNTEPMPQLRRISLSSTAG